MSLHLSEGIPSIQEDAVERRRLLNVLAQRRYRRRKREKLQQSEARIDADPPQAQDDSVTPAIQHNQVGGSAPDEIYHQSTDLQAVSLDNVLLDSDLQDYDESFGLLPSSTGHLFDDMIPDPDPDVLGLTVTGYLDTSSTTAVAAGPSTFNSTGSVVESSQYKQNPALDFADYAITTPGLSVIRAHVQIFQHMHGLNHEMDIFNPRQISPISLGYKVNPSPAQFMPTPLQRQVQHHPIIDLLPWSSFRDRFLYIMTLPEAMRPKIARGDMGNVTLELMLAVKDAGGGIRVWNSDPFSLDSWEIGQTFYSKFWWAIDTEIVKTSNRHRALRREGPLRYNEVDLG